MGISEAWAVMKIRRRPAAHTWTLESRPGRGTMPLERSAARTASVRWISSARVLATPVAATSRTVEARDHPVSPTPRLGRGARAVRHVLLERDLAAPLDLLLTAHGPRYGHAFGRGFAPLVRPVVRKAHSCRHRARSASTRRPPATRQAVSGGAHGARWSASTPSGRHRRRWGAGARRARRARRA